MTKQDIGVIDEFGGYRVHDEPMQVVSGPIYEPIIHFETPPSSRVKFEMDRFIRWFNVSAPDGEKPVAALVRANRDNEITNWLVYFAETVLEAQARTVSRIEFLIAKATRDLAELAAKQALKKTGQLKGARYHLNLGP
ncbi:MAG: hypothetical protein NT011_06225 [Kiritimatiellaeota bacterium]|nr:hypothetical protein [Kiritimatiellota bacterium]